MGWWANPLNPPTRSGLSRVTKFLAHQKVSRVGFTHFQPGSWWANPCELGWLTLTCLLIIFTWLFFSFFVNLLSWNNIKLSREYLRTLLHVDYLWIMTFLHLFIICIYFHPCKWTKIQNDEIFDEWKWEN